MPETSFSLVLKELEEMPLNDFHLYEQYSKIKSMITVLEERREEIAGMIVAEMEMNKEEKKVFEFGSFTLATRKTYSYSEDVKKLEEAVKSKKREEEKSLQATVKTKKYITLN